MEGYNKPEITREDMAGAENVFLCIIHDGETYRRKMPTWARYLETGRDDMAHRFLFRLTNDTADNIERHNSDAGPISYMARAIAAVWLESYYRDHVAEGGLAA